MESQECDQEVGGRAAEEALEGNGGVAKVFSLEHHCPGWEGQPRC